MHLGEEGVRDGFIHGGDVVGLVVVVVCGGRAHDGRG